MRIPAFLGLLFCLIVDSMAQPNALLPTLTVDQAVREAVERNLGLLAERYNLSIAEARLITARLRPNPVFSFGADYLDILGTDFNNINNAGPSEVNFRTDFLWERGRKRESRIAVAQSSAEVVRAQFVESVRQLTLDVENACIDLILAFDGLELAKQNLKAFNEILDVNKSRVAAGDLAQVEMVRSRVAALQYANTVLQSEVRLRIARNRLQALLGRPAGAPVSGIAGEPRRDLGFPTLEEIKRLALVQRPDLLAMQKDRMRAEAEIRSQEAQGKIDLTLGAEYHRQFDNASGNSMGFFLSVPIPVFNRNQGEIRRAKRELQQVEARIRALEASILNEAENSYVQCDAARTLLENIEKNMLQDATDVRRATEYSYRRGEASFVEFLDAQRAFNETTQSYNEARGEYARALYLIDSITGKAVGP